MKKDLTPFRIFCAVGLIIIGVLGLALPIMPGIPILLLGIYMLYPKWFKKKAKDLKKKFKK